MQIGQQLISWLDSPDPTTTGYTMAGLKHAMGALKQSPRGIVVAGAIVAVLITLSHIAPVGWHQMVFLLAAVAVLSRAVASRDRWLGLAVLLGGVTIFVQRLVAPILLRGGPLLGFEHALTLALGGFLLVQVRAVPVTVRPLIVAVFAGCGILLSTPLLLEWWQGVAPYGLFGMLDMSSAYIAITAPLMPVWALPLALAAVYAGHSLGAMLALTSGLAVRYLPAMRRSPWLALSVMGPPCSCAAGTCTRKA
jgi:hypothetical protein